MADYLNIESSGGNFNITGNTFNTTNTSLTLPGQNREQYGPKIIQNWVNLLQHFAGTTSPANPTPGQIWYDTGLNELKLFDSSITTTRVLLENNPSANVTFSNITANSITSSGTITVAEPTRLRVPGGAPGRVLTTDGNSNLYWSSVASGGGAVNGIDGRDGANGISVMTATVYTASSSYPTTPLSGTGTYNFATSTLTPPVGSPPSFEWTISPPVTSTRIYGSSFTFVTTQNNPVATVTAGNWGPPFLAYATGRDGVDGASATSIYNMAAYIRWVGQPDTPQAGTGGWNFTSAAGIAPTSIPQQVWALSPPSGTNQLWVSYATATVAGSTGDNTNSLVWSTPVQLAQTGAAGTDGLSIYNYAVYQDSSVQPTTPTGGSYSFGDRTGIPPSGWSLTPTGSRIWISVARAQAPGTTGVWTGTSNSWSTPVEFTGIPGQDSISGYLTNENITVGADVSGNVAPEILALASGQFKVFYGTTDVTAQATYQVVGAPAGINVTINASGTYTVNSFTADTAIAKIRASYLGITIEKDFSISKSKTGVPGQNGSDASLLYLSATSQSFTYTGTNLPNPVTQTITFTVFLQNVQGTPTINKYNDEIPANDQPLGDWNPRSDSLRTA